MNWFVTERMKWIAETLAVYGYINRAHLARKFGISGQCAALDFIRFNEINPGKMQYDNRKKAYIAAAPLKNPFGK